MSADLRKNLFHNCMLADLDNKFSADTASASYILCLLQNYCKNPWKRKAAHGKKACSDNTHPENSRRDSALPASLNSADNSKSGLLLILQLQLQVLQPELVKQFFLCP